MTINEGTLLAGARPPYMFNKSSVTTEGAGTWHSLWKVAGYPAPATSNPPAYTAGSGYVPTRSTLGALGQVNAAGGNELRAIALEAGSTVAGKLIIYDRLWHCSGFATNTTTLQSVTTPGVLPSGRLLASGDFSDVEAWLEMYTTDGATTATWTINVKDGGGSGGTARAFTYTHPANAESVGQMMPLTGVAGAVAGVQEMTSFQCSVSSGGAGDVGITLLRRLATIAMTGTGAGLTGSSFKGALDLALSRVKDDACLAAMIHCSATTSGIIVADLGLSEVTP